MPILRRNYNAPGHNPECAIAVRFQVFLEATQHPDAPVPVDTARGGNLVLGKWYVFHTTRRQTTEQIEPID